MPRRSAVLLGSSAGGELKHSVAGRVLACVTCAWAASACAPAGRDGMGDESTEPNTPFGAPASETSAGDARRVPVCVAPSGSSPPRSIADVVDRVNALPRPVTLACFLEAMARPLELYASESIFSAQPAVGRRSPRMFFFVDPLIMSIAPDGPGSHLLELGERRSDTRSIKAEIEFPVTSELVPEAPFERLVFEERLTICSGCHAAEQPATDITFTQAFVSQALRPVPRERVSLGEALAESRVCDAEAEPERCAILRAVFSQGDVVDRDFPTAMETFY
jgi:hypothetical protein